MFAALQTDFARALLDPDRPVPTELTSHTARHPQKRFAVYRNNVVVSLVNALRAKFPGDRTHRGRRLLRRHGAHLS